MSPNYYSAVLLDNIVSSLSILEESLDYSLSLKEHSAGADSSSYDLEIGYGFSSIKTNKSANLLKILSIGKGLSKTASGLSYIPLSADETGFTIQDIISFSNTYKNCYLFGSVFLVLNGSSTIITTSLSKPALDPSSSVPLIICKDIELQDAIDMISLSSEISTTSGYATDLELFKFVFDIDYYDGDSKTARLGLYLIDNRKTRGVLPYADEDLSFSFISTLNQNYINNQRIYDKTKSNIKLIVNDWVSLSSWDPSFVEYWTTPGNTLPANLKNFLQNELGIIV
jgi:hypothetical protein